MDVYLAGMILNRTSKIIIKEKEIIYTDARSVQVLLKIVILHAIISGQCILKKEE